MTTHHQLLSNLTLDSHIYMYIYVLDHGVAQGSMLSPTLSNSVMAQLPPLLSPALYLTIYADLICIWVFGSCLTAVQFHLRDGRRRAFRVHRPIYKYLDIVSKLYLVLEQRRLSRNCGTYCFLIIRALNCQV